MIKLQPGYLVALKTRVQGGHHSEREEVGTHVNADGSEVVEWNTKRTIQDPEEHKAAGQIRSAISNRIKAACVWTPFGLICPAGQVERLDQALAEAETMRNEFNGFAQTCKVVFGTIRGEIAESSTEAVAAVQSEVSALLADMQAAMTLGDIGSIRDLAGRAKQMARLLEGKTNATDALGRAIAAARKVAREIVKRVEKGGEDLAAVLTEAALAPIATARFAFDPDAAPEAFVEAEASEGFLPLALPVPDTTDADPVDYSLPSIDVARFVALDDDLTTTGDDEGGAL